MALHRVAIEASVVTGILALLSRVPEDNSGSTKVTLTDTIPVDIARVWD
jgi:hypothetical protein